MLLSLAACGGPKGPTPTPDADIGSVGDTDGPGSAAPTENEREPAAPDDPAEGSDPTPSVSIYEPVEMEEVVYDANGVKITLLGYRLVPEEEIDEYNSAAKVKLRIEKTAESAQFAVLKTSVNGWLTSNDPVIMSMNAADIDPAGTERELSISSWFMDRCGITELSEMGVLFAVKTDDVFVLDHVSLPLFSPEQAPAVSSRTEGFYNPGVLVNVSNFSPNSIEAYYLVKCRDAEGHQLRQINNMTGEMFDASIKSVMVKAGAEDMPAEIRAAYGSEWEYGESFYVDYKIADAEAEFLYAIAYPADDLSDKITVTETSRPGGNDPHVYGHIEWPEEIGRISAFGTLLRYQNGELKGVTSYWSTGLDPAKEDNFFYFDCYARDYSNESFETVVNFACANGQ